MEHKKVTIYDLAREAGVSTATVSRVIAGNYPVSQGTREKVQQIIDHYNYHPNALARTLSNKKSKLIGFITPAITNPFFSQVFVEVEKSALEKGYSVLLGNSLNDREIEARYIRMLLEQQAEGIILLGGLINDSNPDLERVQELIAIQKRTKLVMINGSVEGMGNCSISTDEAAGMRLIIDHLVRQGHRKIGLIGGVKGITTTDIKVSTFKAELKKHQLIFRKSWQCYSEYSIEGGEDGFKQLMSLNKEVPTALIGINDMVGVGMIKASKRYPNQHFAFVGFDDTSLAQTSSPELTSVRHPYEELGKRAIEMMEANAKAQHVMLAPSLVVKESTVKSINRV
ncbi:LacI family transcriptional regulator [Amphibacillus marinus]|uniref:LacI family transcriptional regulator n=1 Tax=Amphibacillus marinus TaxID=872970 RepID=A0A1H8T9R3_9BACI|nr:LacI family DNA-binding transcriptional regulator [Amphibacillus marinus]SEO87800.1 LacI family transcriptional regulator [Amphibacillus marinus]